MAFSRMVREDPLFMIDEELPCLEKVGSILSTQSSNQSIDQAEKH